MSWTIVATRVCITAACMRFIHELAAPSIWNLLARSSGQPVPSSWPIVAICLVTIVLAVLLWRKAAVIDPAWNWLADGLTGNQALGCGAMRALSGFVVCSYGSSVAAFQLADRLGQQEMVPGWSFSLAPLDAIGSIPFAVVFILAPYIAKALYREQAAA